EALFEHHAGTIYNFGYRMCRHPEDAQDVLQETFLAAFKGLKNFRETARLTTWLYKIASSACLKKRRKGKYAPARELSIEEFLPLSREGEGPPQIADWSRHPLTKLERKELQRLLAAAVAGLPEDYRVVLVLRDMEGLSAREVARILGISAAAVKSRLHRARLFVRERLSAYHETA
ncbi:MAG: RNA polymerase sigma factor, partial [Nitrospirae bacterium]|nr:RNA polymerase sigma factor [Nitrospirota bacterium]